MSKYTATVLDRETLEAMLLEQGYVKTKAGDYVDMKFNYFKKSMFEFCGKEINITKHNVFWYLQDDQSDINWSFHKRWLKDIKEVS